MSIISRAQWGAKYAKGSSRIPGPIHGVTLHWEGPKMGNFPHASCAGKVRSIERFHAVTRGWAGIAYTAIVCPHGTVFEGRGVGVRSAANGTSSIGGNDHWYAVCYMSGQGDGFTDAGKAGIVEAVQWLRAKGGAGDKVNGHRDHHATECPGSEIYAWLQRTNFAPAKPVKRPVVKKPAKKPQPKPVPDAAILAATTVTTPSDHKAVGARIKAGAAEFVAVTANIRATPPMRAVNVQRCVDRALGHGVTVAGFNEMGGRNLVALLRKHPGWVALQGKRGDQARAPIAYDSHTWELVRWEVRRLSTRTVATRLGPIPVPSGNRDATIAVLGHKNTGTEVAFISYHAIAHMNVGSRFGWTGRGPKALLTLRRKISNPAIAVFKQGMAVLEETINELRADGCYVVPMGDWNYDAFADLRDKTPELFGPRATMRRAGVTTIYSAKKLTHGTAGKRGIDYIGVAAPITK